MMRRFQKAQSPMQQSAARTAYLALSSKIDEIRGLQRDVTREIIALEGAGAVPEPPTLSDEFDAPDDALINGAAFAGAAMPPPGNADNIRLFGRLRRKQQLALTLSEAERQMFAAPVELSAELLAIYDSEIRTLHR